MKRSCASTSPTGSSPTAGRAAACATASTAGENFTQATGLDLPRTSNPQDPARKQYIVWRQQRLFELWRLWNEKIRAINPDASYIANAGGGALSDLDMKTINELAPTLFADRQGRRGLMAPWANGKNGKEYRATMGSKAIAGMFSVGIEDEHRWKDSVQNGDEIRMWVADGMAQGLRPWFIKFNAKPIDRRWLPVGRRNLQVALRQRKIFQESSPAGARGPGLLAAERLVLRRRSKPAKKSRNRRWDSTRRWLKRAFHLRWCTTAALTQEHLAPFRTLILPNIAALIRRAVRQPARICRARRRPGRHL